MDRVIAYPGAIPLAEDMLNTNRFAMTAIGRLAAGLLGSGTTIAGLACTPTPAPSLAVAVGPGEIYTLKNIDDTAYSTLPADTARTIIKQGHADATTFAAPAPTGAGLSINYLIQASYSDVDANPLVTPYYNSSNPAQAFSGPNNTGAPVPSIRAGVCNLSIKAGTAATTDSQATPSVDPGNVGLWVITVGNGATSVAAGNIAPYPGAPFLPAGGLLSAIPTVPVTSVAGRTGAVALTVGDVAGAAPLTSPVLIGTPAAPTPASGDNSTKLATTAFVATAIGTIPGSPVTSVAGRGGAVTLAVGDVGGAAPLASPAFTGAPTSTTPAVDDNSGRIATTAFAQALAPTLSTDGSGNWKHTDASGFIEMGGIVAGPANEGAFSLTFPFGGFPNACFGVLAMSINTASSPTGDTSAQEVSISTTGANLFAQNQSGGAISDTSGGYRWVAKGR